MPPSDPGVWSYITSTGASTHVIRTDQRLLAIRFFAFGTTGNVKFYPRSQTTGQTTATPVKVRTGGGFDWTPAAKVSPMVIVVSAAIDMFGEVSS